MEIRRGVMLSIKASCRSAYNHPYITGMLFYLLILYRAFPSLFAFLLSSSPVIISTAMLLGLLLSYGTPSIPEIEKEENTSRENSSLQIGPSVDDLVVKKDESLTEETHLETETELNEGANDTEVIQSVTDTELSKRAIEAAVIGEPSICEGNHEKEIERELKVSYKRELDNHGFVEEKVFSSENQDEVPINDQKEVEALTVRIGETAAANSAFDSSLGSPWQPVDSGDISSGSELDGAESSSPDASIADIMPMLDELYPLLESEHPHTLRVNEDSDSSSSSSELSEDHKSDDGVPEDDHVPNKVDSEKELERSNSDVAVTWTADDQKNVMDLGVSELERNRRLESLIAKRRLRKLQKMETEKNLIDLDKYYPSIPSISAPRRNPFDLPDEDLNYPPLPGSAPSVLQPRRNPFDLLYEHREEAKTSSTILSREYFSNSEFVSASQTHPCSTEFASFSGDCDEEKSGSTLKEFSLIFSDYGFDMVSPFTGQEDKKRLTEPEIIHHDSTLSPKFSSDVEHIEEQDAQFFQQKVDTVDKQHEESGMDIEDNNHAIDLTKSTNIETKETHQDVFASSVMEDEILQVDSLADLHAEELQVIEESNSTETNEKSGDVDVHEELIKIGKTRDLSDPIYDISPSETGETIYIIEQLNSIDSQLESSLLLSSEDPELTVYNANKLHVLEGSSFEELDSIFKNPHEEAVVPAPAIDLMYEKSAELENTHENQVVTVTDTEWVDLEAKSIEDVSSLLKGLRKEGLHKSSISNIEPSEVQVQPEGYDFEPEETDSNFHVVDAKTLEDINLAMTQVSGVDDISSVLKGLREEGLHKSSISEMEPSEVQVQPEGYDFEHEETNSNFHVVDAKSLEDLNLVMKQLSNVNFERLSEYMEDKVEASKQHLEEFHVEPSEIQVQPEGYDFEHEETNSNFHVLDAKSLEDINLAMKQLSEVDFERLPEDMEHTAEAREQHLEEFYVEPSEVQVQQQRYDVEPEETNSNFRVVDAKTVEDINLAINQQSEVTAEKLPEDMEYTTEASKRHLKPEALEVQSPNFHVIDAKSFEDKNLAMQQLSDVNVEKHPEEMEHTAEASERHLKLENFEVQSLEPADKRLEPEGFEGHSLEESEGQLEPEGCNVQFSEFHVVDAKTVEDINLAMRKLSEDNVERLPEEMEHTEVSGDERHLKPAKFEVQSSEASEHLEGQFAKEIKLDSEKAASTRTAMIGERSSENFDALEAAASNEIVKGNSGKSRSGTSSSDSE